MKRNKSAETKRLYLNSFYLVILHLIIYNKIYNEGIGYFRCWNKCYTTMVIRKYSNMSKDRKE